MADDQNWWGDAPEVPKESGASDQSWYADAPMAEPSQTPVAKIASETADAADEHLLTYEAPDSDTWTGWAARAGRAASFGAADPLSAAIMKYAPDWLGGNEVARNADYSEVLGAIRQGYEDDKSLSAEVVGSIAPGAAVGKAAIGIGRVAAAGAARTGLVNGAMRWAGRHPKLARIAGSAAMGSEAAGAYEAVRSSIDEGLDAWGGDGFNPQNIIDATVQGAIVGAVLTPVADEALAGAGGVYQWAKAALVGSDDAQAAQATKRIVTAIARPGEQPDAAVMRLRNDVQQFTAENGRPPALFEILPPEKTEELSDVIRFYSGLGQRAKELAETQVERSIMDLDAVVNSGLPLKDTLQIQRQADGLFSAVAAKYGKTPVAVSDEAMDVLGQNRAWLGKQHNNPATREIERVLDARDNVTAIQSKVDNLIKRKNVADARQEVAELGEDIARILDDQHNASSLPSSELAALRNLKRLRDSIAKRMAATNAADVAGSDVSKFSAELQFAKKALTDYRNEGLKITLSDANALRAAASRYAFRSTDLAEQDAARAVRDAVSQVGVDEVPIYGRVVKLYSKAMTRKEAQDAGRAAVKGSESPENLAEWVGRGVTPKGKNVSPNNLKANQRGADEGARLEIRDATQGRPSDAIRLAENISESPRIQRAIRTVSPNGDRIAASAEQVNRTTQGAKALARAKSPTELQEEINQAKETVESVLFGKLGGAATAGIVARQLMKFKIPRGTAKKLVEMMGDPDQLEKALTYVARRGIDVRRFVAIAAAEIENADQ